MRFLHTSDLHIGKRLHEQPLIDEQRHMLEQLLAIACEHKASAILIAGDVYDRTVPPLDAVDLFDDFLTRATELAMSVFVIAGNHDSAERLDFGARIMGKQQVHISGRRLRRVEHRDGSGSVNIWLMPYMRAAHAEAILAGAEVDSEQCNIILAHQFVLASGAQTELAGSETLTVGGLDAMDVGLFDRFDYVALGHIHKPQRIGRDTVQYAGSPFPYSFDECTTQKSAVIVEVEGRGAVSCTRVPLVPKRGLYRLRCTLAQLPEQTAPRDAYVEVTLTDDEPIVDAIEKVRQVYPNTLRLLFDSRYSRSLGIVHRLETNDIKVKTPLELFESFFEEMHGTAMTQAQQALVMQALEGNHEAH